MWLTLPPGLALPSLTWSSCSPWPGSGCSLSSWDSSGFGDGQSLITVTRTSTSKKSSCVRSVIDCDGFLCRAIPLASRRRGAVGPWRQRRTSLPIMWSAKSTAGWGPCPSERSASSASSFCSWWCGSRGSRALSTAGRHISSTPKQSLYLMITNSFVNLV